MIKLWAGNVGQQFYFTGIVNFLQLGNAHLFLRGAFCGTTFSGISNCLIPDYFVLQLPGIFL